MTAASTPGSEPAGLAAADLTPGRPLVFRNATVLTMDDAHHVLTGADVLVEGDRIAAVGPGLQVPDGTAEIDATGGILMPRHDRHAPAHVADGHARLRRRLDAHPVLRLELPAVGQVVPAGGHLRGRPAERDRGDRRRGDHHRGLVAQPAYDRPRRRGGGRAPGGPRAVRPRLRQHPGGPVGVVGHSHGAAWMLP